MPGTTTAASGGRPPPSIARADRADDGARAQRGHEQAEHVDAFVQHLPGEERDEDAVVHGEGADREHEAQDERDERRPRRIADAVHGAPRGSSCRAAAWPPIPTRTAARVSTHGQEGQRVQQERDRGAVAGDEEPAQRGADDPGGVEGGRVERDGVQEILPADHLDEEGLPGRHVERVHQADHARERGDVPVAHPAGPREAGEGEGRQHQGHLGRQDEAALRASGPRRRRRRPRRGARGPNWSALTTPRRNGELVSSRTSQESPTDCIQLPTDEMD